MTIHEAADRLSRVSRLVNRVWIITGTHGSGKTTVCKKLADNHGWVYVPFDGSFRDHEWIRLLTHACQTNRRVVFDPSFMVKNCMIYGFEFDFNVLLIEETPEVVMGRLAGRGSHVPPVEDIIKRQDVVRSSASSAIFSGSADQVYAWAVSNADNPDLGRYVTYLIRDNFTDHVIYVGKGQYSQWRSQGHARVTRFENHKLETKRAITAYDDDTDPLYRYMAEKIVSGETSFRYEVVGQFHSELEALTLEAELIKAYADVSPLLNRQLNLLINAVNPEDSDDVVTVEPGSSQEACLTRYRKFRLSDNELEWLRDRREGTQILAHASGAFLLTDDEVHALRSRRNLIRYHENPVRRAQVLEWHAAKNRKGREFKLKAKGLPSDFEGRIGHLSHLTEEQKKDRYEKIYLLRSRQRQASIAGHAEKVRLIEDEIAAVNKSFGVSSIRSSQSRTPVSEVCRSIRGYTKIVSRGDLSSFDNQHKKWHAMLMDKLRAARKVNDLSEISRLEDEISDHVKNPTTWIPPWKRGGKVFCGPSGSRRSRSQLTEDEKRLLNNLSAKASVRKKCGDLAGEKDARDQIELLWKSVADRVNHAS